MANAGQSLLDLFNENYPTRPGERTPPLNVHFSRLQGQGSTLARDEPMVYRRLDSTVTLFDQARHRLGELDGLTTARVEEFMEVVRRIWVWLRKGRALSPGALDEFMETFAVLS